MDKRVFDLSTHPVLSCAGTSGCKATQVHKNTVVRQLQIRLDSFRQRSRSLHEGDLDDDPARPVKVAFGVGNAMATHCVAKSKVDRISDIAEGAERKMHRSCLLVDRYTMFDVKMLCLRSYYYV